MPSARKLLDGRAGSHTWNTVQPIGGKTTKLDQLTGNFTVVRLSWPDRKKFYVHALVNAAFNGPRPSGYVCRHLNDNHLDNRAENLAWGTYSQNVEDARLNGKLATGERCRWQHRQRNLLGQFQ